MYFNIIHSESTRERNKKAESQQNRYHLRGKIQKDGATFSSYNNTITNSNTIAQLLSQEEINDGKSQEKNQSIPLLYL